MHGNPAIWPQYGNWGYLEFGRAQDGRKLTSFIVSSRLAGDVHGFAELDTALDSKTQKIGGNVALAFPLFAGFYLGGSAGLDLDGKPTGQAGLAHVLLRERFIVRSGLDYNPVADLARVGSEVRGLLGVFELTGSGNVKFVLDGADSEYAGQTLGAQARYGDHLVSFGAGGAEADAWAEMHAHYRVFVGDTLIDFHVMGKGRQLVRDPNYAGIGVTRLW